MTNIYMASKLKHARKWRELYLKAPQEIQIVSRWPFFLEVEVTSENARRFWKDNMADLERCDVVVVYLEEGDRLVGGIAEAGAALSMGKIVCVVGDTDNSSLGTWQYITGVRHFPTFMELFEYLIDNPTADGWWKKNMDIFSDKFP